MTDPSGSTGRQTHDRARLERLYRDHAGSVYRFARQRVSPTDAEDVVCEVFAIAWRRLPEVPAAEIGWLLGTARRVVADQLRARRRRHALADRAAVQLPVPHGPDPAREVVDRAEVDWVLSQLPARDQEVLRLLLVQDLTVGEIAAALHCRPNTASVRLRRARERLAAVYHRTGGPEPAPAPRRAPPPPTLAPAQSPEPTTYSRLP